MLHPRREGREDTQYGARDPIFENDPWAQETPYEKVWNRKCSRWIFLFYLSGLIMYTHIYIYVYTIIYVCIVLCCTVVLMLKIGCNKNWLKLQQLMVFTIMFLTSPKLDPDLGIYIYGEKLANVDPCLIFGQSIQRERSRLKNWTNNWRNLAATSLLRETQKSLWFAQMHFFKGFSSAI